jgi:hypothetical protein
MSTPKLCKLMSSCGEVTFDATTGTVKGIVHYEDDDPLPNIYKVDVDRLRELLPAFADTHGEVDILNAGFWYLNESWNTEYEPPEPNHSEWAAGRREFPF